jgi:hypothetical protein
VGRGPSDADPAAGAGASRCFRGLPAKGRGGERVLTRLDSSSGSGRAGGNRTASDKEIRSFWKVCVLLVTPPRLTVECVRGRTDLASQIYLIWPSDLVL